MSFVVFENLLKAVQPLVILAIRFILTLTLYFTCNSEYNAFLKKEAAHYYDFIVVGSGSAGSPVAARLSEIETWKVLLLEAGGTPFPESYVPAMAFFSSIAEPEWAYHSTHQSLSLFGYKNNSNPYLNGRVLGGSSNVNGLVYERGNKNDFDRWHHQGNEGWDFKTVLKYYKKIEDYRGIITPENEEFRSSGGPLSLERKSVNKPAAYAFLKAGEELGFPIKNPNGRDQLGFSFPDLTLKNGVRISTAEAYIKPNLRRPNFDVLTKAYVTKVLFDDQNRAIGVQYEHGGQVKLAYARKEVILSAGTLDSPKILMLSGVGPKKHLESLKIPVIVDLPGVGQNLQDHQAIFGLNFHVNQESTYQRSEVVLSYGQYQASQKGPLSIPLGSEAYGFVNVSNNDQDWPDLQILCLTVGPEFDYGLSSPDVLRIKKELFNDYYQPLVYQHAIALYSILLRPKSRGYLTLTSTDPHVQPNINPNFFSNPEDLEFFVRAIRFCIKLSETKAFRKIGAKIYAKPLLGCLYFVWGTDEYWRCFARHMAPTFNHPVGTCKMANPVDFMGVVDNRLRVRGVTGLRVIDGSIMPEITSGNIHAPIVMIGERGADFIKEDWGIPVSI